MGPRDALGGARALVMVAGAAGTLALAPAAHAVTETFNYNGDGVAPHDDGSAQTWTVPAGVSSATFTLYGAQGGTSTNAGGFGGETIATLTGLAAGMTFEINVGGTGVNCVPPNIFISCTAPGGFNGGGTAVGDVSVSDGSGGGASDVRLCATPGSCVAADRVLVAGGGGGATPECTPAGAGGGEVGGDGCGSNFGHGGTQSAAGAGCCGGTTNGSGPNGGTGGGTDGGAGGGGFFGGGGGGAGALDGAGGGGSGFCGEVPGCTTTAGVQTGQGQVEVSYKLDEVACQTPPGEIDPIGSAYMYAVMEDIPAGYWRLGEETGPTAFDSSGFDRHGTYTGTFTLGIPGAIAGDPDTAADFSPDPKARVPTPYNPFQAGSVRSFEGWACREENKGFDVLFSGDKRFNSPGLWTDHGDLDRIWFDPRREGGTAPRFWDGVMPPDEGWFHWVLVFNDATNTAELFINSISQGTRSVTEPYHSSPGNFQIGNYAQINEAWNGPLDEVAVYERALGAEEICIHYTTGIGQPDCGFDN